MHLHIRANHLPANMTSHTGGQQLQHLQRVVQQQLHGGVPDVATTALVPAAPAPNAAPSHRSTSSDKAVVSPGTAHSRLSLAGTPGADGVQPWCCLHQALLQHMSSMQQTQLLQHGRSWHHFCAHCRPHVPRHLHPQAHCSTGHTWVHMLRQLAAAACCHPCSTTWARAATWCGTQQRGWSGRLHHQAAAASVLTGAQQPCMGEDWHP